MKKGNILKNGYRITDQKEVDNELFDFYNNLSKSDKRSSKHDIAQFMSLIEIPRLTEEQSAKCEVSISEDELICALKSVLKNKSLGNGLTKEIYETSWDELKIPFIAKIISERGVKNSQKQAIIRLIEKKEKDKGLSRIGDHYLC